MKSMHFILMKTTKESNHSNRSSLIPTKDYICQKTQEEDQTKSSTHVLHKNHNYFQSQKLQATKHNKHTKKKSVNSNDYSKD